MGAHNSKREKSGNNNALLDKYCTLNGIYPECPWDRKYILKLVMDKKVGPICPGHEEKIFREMDECPICFMYYPGGLNTTSCCKHEICTECYLQIKKPNSKPEDSLCPFCTRDHFSVVYQGPKSEEQRDKEEEEEQKVKALQLKIETPDDTSRERQCDPAQELLRSQRSSASDLSDDSESDGPENKIRIKRPRLPSNKSSASTSVIEKNSPLEIMSSSSTSSSPEKDLEDLMLMEAIRLSLIDQSVSRARREREERKESTAGEMEEQSEEESLSEYSSESEEDSDGIIAGFIEIPRKEKKKRSISSGTSPFWNSPSRSFD